MNIGILGYGQIGKSIARCYKKKTVNNIDLYVYDRQEELCKRMVNEKEVLDVLHICVPYNEKKRFCDSVHEAGIQWAINKTLVIIHSTVDIGVTNYFSKCYGNRLTVHSPVRGVHPNLYEGLKTFVKYIGCDDIEAGYKAKDHMEKYMLIACRIVSGSRNTEAGKLWSVNQYGINILIEKTIYKYCKDNDLDYRVVYKDFNTSYNRGYEKLDDNRFRKYVIDHMDGGMGGHCLCPDLEIVGDELCKFALKYNERFKG